MYVWISYIIVMLKSTRNGMPQPPSQNNFDSKISELAMDIQQANQD